MNKPELAECPVIAAVKNEAQLENALRSECEVVFLLFGDLLNVAELTERVRPITRVSSAFDQLLMPFTSGWLAFPTITM